MMLNIKIGHKRTKPSVIISLKKKSFTSDGASLPLIALVKGDPLDLFTSLAMSFPAGPMVPKRIPINRYAATVISKALLIFAPIDFGLHYIFY